MSQATEIYSREFDAIFFELPPRMRRRIQDKIRFLGLHLDEFPHERLPGQIGISIASGRLPGDLRI